MNKLNKFIVAGIVLISIIFLFSQMVSAENHEIAGIKFEFNILTEDITAETLIPMHQFMEKTDLTINRFADNYFIFQLDDRHMLIIPGEKEVRIGREKYELNTAPLKINDDILIPYSLAENFLLGEDLVKRDNNDVEDEINNEIKTGLHLVLMPETKTVKKNDEFEVKIKLINYTSSSRSFTFNTGQKYELQLLDKDDSVVFVWSRGKAFIQAIQTLEVEAGEKEKWTAKINTSGIEAGKYQLKGWLTDRKRSLTADSVEILIE